MRAPQGTKEERYQVNKLEVAERDHEGSGSGESNGENGMGAIVSFRNRERHADLKSGEREERDSACFPSYVD